MMGEAKKRGNLIKRLRQSQQKRKEEQESESRRCAEIEAYIAAMSVPLVKGERVEYTITSGRLRAIRRPALGITEPAWGSPVRRSEAAFKINRVLDLVPVDGAGRVGCTYVKTTIATETEAEEGGEE